VLIPEHITAAQLHEVIPAAMGWTDDHLHQFMIRALRYGEAREGAPQFARAAIALTLSASVHASMRSSSACTTSMRGGGTISASSDAR